jgi:hypothetical protein
MVLTTSPILRKVNILLIQEGVDYIIKNYYLSAAAISNLASGYIKDQVWVIFESKTDKKQYFHIHPKRKLNSREC